MRLRSAALVACLLLAACSTADPPMTRSCRGEYVNECRPYTYATIGAAELTPDGITLGDPAMRAHVHVDFTRCGGSTMPVRIDIAAFIGGGPDGSLPPPIDGATSDARVIPLTTIAVTDTSASSVDTMIDNPFFTNSVPPNTRITLQFATIIDGCEGELFTMPYQTGPQVTTP